MRWNIITGEYPPQPGGVSDYTAQVAHGLLAAGDQVEVWAPPCPQNPGPGGDIPVHRLPDDFGPRSIAAMQRGLRPSSGTRVLVQFVPHAFGWRGMNLPLCLWIAARYRKNLTVTFHEVSYPVGREQSLRHNLLGVTTRLMALTLARAAREIIVTTPTWQQLLGPSAAPDAKTQWAPVPGNIPVAGDRAAIDALRSRFALSRGPVLGHFGTYGSLVTDSLLQIFPALMAANRDLPLMLLGRGSDAFRARLVRDNPALANRIHAAGDLPAAELSHHIAACGLFVQFYPDGITCRRTSTMALLAHGRAVATTCGPMTENIWRESKAVAMAPANDLGKLAQLALELYGDETRRRQLQSAATATYDQRFDIRHTISALRRDLK